MRKVMVKYIIKRDELEHFQKALTDFVENVQKETPEILEYNVLQGPDQVSFVHYIAFKTEEAIPSHCSLASTQNFTLVLKNAVASTPTCVYLNNQGQTDTTMTEEICMYGCSTYPKKPEITEVPQKPKESKEIAKGDVVVYRGGTFISANGNLYFYVENHDNFAGDTTQATLYHISPLGKDGWELGLPKELLEKVGHIDEYLMEAPEESDALREHLEKLKKDLEQQ